MELTGSLSKILSSDSRKIALKLPQGLFLACAKITFLQSLALTRRTPPQHAVPGDMTGARLLYKPQSRFPCLTSSACLGIRAGPQK